MLDSPSDRLILFSSTGLWPHILAERRESGIDLLHLTVKQGAFFSKRHADTSKCRGLWDGQDQGRKRGKSLEMRGLLAVLVSYMPYISAQLLEGVRTFTRRLEWLPVVHVFVFWEPISLQVSW